MGPSQIQYVAGAEIDASHYDFRVHWSAEDGEHVATTVEWGPGLSWLADSPAEAVAGLQTVIGDMIADLRERGETVPPPLTDRTYSGTFNLRVGPALHARLAREAAEERVSLNQLVMRRLAAG